MKALAGFVAVVLAAWLQVSWFGHMRPLGVMPNLVLILVVLWGLWFSATSTVAAALFGGLLLDMAAGDGTFGLRMAFFVMVALAIIAGRQFGIRSDSLLTALIAVGLGTVVYNCVILSTIGMPLEASVLSRIVRELGVNLVLTWFIYSVRILTAGFRIRSERSAWL